MSKHTSESRRHFLRCAAAMGASGPAAGMLGLPLAGLGALASQTSAAADLSGGYKALVCLFMHGGNDSHNWIVPMDTAGYTEYSRARADLAVPLARLQSIAAPGQAAGRSFGMPTELAPLRKWYQQGQAAVVANVGPLVRPISRADYLAGVALPSKLFSHNDQASTWQSLSPEGASTGWGGRMGDVLASANAYPVFTSISAGGNAVFLSGNTITQYQVGTDNVVSVGALSSPWLFGAPNAGQQVRRVITATGSSPLQAEYARVMQRSVDTSALLGTALTGVTVPPIPATVVPQGDATTTLDNVGLARQLCMVAKLIGAGQQLGMRRQVFMVSMSGFDTHANQMRDQPGLMAQVANSIDYFLSSLQAMGLLNNVVLFTASDFGRTLLSNGDGSDHGWGSHQFVAGGPVAGGAIHGRFPVTALGTPDDIGSGRLLPSYSVSQMAAPLGRWMGLSFAELTTVLPGLGNFDAGALRFL